MVVKGEKCMITGGLGFLGKNLVERLLRRGAHVRVLDLRLPATEIEETFKRLASDFGGKVEFFAGDLTKKDDCLLAVDGMDVIFHCASPSPALQNKKIFYAVNVGGTTNLLEACGEKGITRFVHTSSASVIYEGKSYEYGDEASLPYAANPMDYYTETKILAEKIVLESNGSNGVMTVAIRPHGLFGPHDPLLVPTLVDTCKSGKMKFIIGNGDNLVDFTYIGNVCQSLELCADKLQKGSPVCGNAYFITNAEPVKFWDFTGDVLEGLGYPRPSIHLPASLLFFVAYILLGITRLLELFGKTYTPTFTPSRIALTSTHHYYSCEKAKRELGYEPEVSMKEGMRQTLASFDYLRKDN